MASDLLTRLREAREGSRELDWAVHHLLFGVEGIGAYGTQSPVTTSIDAAVALCSRVLPGWWIETIGEIRSAIIYKGDKHKPSGWMAALQHEDGGLLTQAAGNSPALALVIATILAKDAAHD